MKVAHIIWSMSLGGSENMLVDIINEQVKTTGVVLIIVNNVYESDLLKKLHPHVSLHLLNRTPCSRNIVDIFKLNNIILQEYPQVIHCHNHDLLGAIKIHKFLPVKICLTVHDTNILSNYFNKYDRLFSISGAVKRDIETNYNIDSCVIPNGINFSEVQKRTRGKEDVFSIVQASRLDHKKKGQDILIRALHKLKHEHNVSNIEITFIGEGTSRGFLEDLAKELKVNENCIFLGAQDRNYIYNNLQEYDLLVQPSYYEGFGLTIIEGIAAMLPVLVSDIEGPLEIVQGGKYGYMFRVGDPVDLAEKIISIINNYNTDSFQQKCFDSYKYASRNFDISVTASSYIDSYSSLVCC